MSLKDLVVPTAEVQLPGGSFAVRALNLSDLKYLLGNKGDALRELFQKFMDSDVAVADVVAYLPLLKQVAVKAPDLVVDIVARAANADAEDRAKIEQMPLGVHMDALGKIAMLTLTVDGDPKKSMEAVTKILSGLNFAADALVQAKAKAD